MTKKVIGAGPNGAGIEAVSRRRFAAGLRNIEQAMGRKQMNANDIFKAKDPDLRAALGALRRAAQLARKTAIQTETNIVIVKDGRMLRISADELRQQALAAAVVKESLTVPSWSGGHEIAGDR